MTEFNSLNGVMPKATKANRCHAKECVKFGSLPFIVNKSGKSKWTYLMCDEHFRLLTDSDKKYIARTEGTKVPVRPRPA